MGELDPNTTLLKNLQPSNENGLFMISEPISCNGTIVSVTANGFCVLTRRTDQTVSLRLRIYQLQDNEFILRGDPIARIDAYCNSSTATTTSSGIEYSIGSVSAKCINIPVTAGDFLAVRFNRNCIRDICLFQPAIVSNNDTQIMYGRVMGPQINETEFQINSNFSLFLSAKITGIYIIV